MKDTNYIDLRGIVCPLNFIRCKLALEKLTINQLLFVDIDLGEPVDMVIPGLTKEGHKVEIISKSSSYVKIKIICNSGRT